MTVLNLSFCQFIEYQDAHACKLINLKHWLYFQLCLQFYYFWERVSHWFCFLCVLLVLCLFVVLVFGWILASSFDWLPIPLQGQDFGQITSVPNRCNFLYGQTLFAVMLVYIFNKFCFCSFMLNNFWSFHDVFSKLVPQSSKWQFNQGISYPLSDLIVLDETLRRYCGHSFFYPIWYYDILQDVEYDCKHLWM